MSTNCPHPLWIEQRNGALVAAGHSEPLAAGHVVYSTETGQYIHLVRGRHDRLEYWRIAPENFHRFGLTTRPVTS